MPSKKNNLWDTMPSKQINLWDTMPSKKIFMGYYAQTPYVNEPIYGKLCPKMWDTMPNNKTI